MKRRATYRMTSRARASRRPGGCSTAAIDLQRLSSDISSPTSPRRRVACDAAAPLRTRRRSSGRAAARGPRVEEERAEPGDVAGAVRAVSSTTSAGGRVLCSSRRSARAFAARVTATADVTGAGCGGLRPAPAAPGRTVTRPSTCSSCDRRLHVELLARPPPLGPPHLGTHEASCALSSRPPRLSPDPRPHGRDRRRHLGRRGQRAAPRHRP